MISFIYPSGVTPLWQAYAANGWGIDGFRGFTSRTIPYATVEGTTAEGLTLHFETDEDLVAFKLKWL